MKRKGIIISIIGIIIVALSLLGITFGYYYTQIFGNENATSVKVTSAMKAVKYVELSEEVSGTLIKPGYEYIKTFAATSLSTEEEIYHIYLDEVINEFTRTQDITYTLYRKSGNNTIDTSNLSDCEEISSGIFPKTNSYIKLNEKLLTKGDSYTYALKINYLESTEEQDIDDGKTFGFKVQLHSEIVNPYKNDTTLLAYNIINNAKTGANGTTLMSTPLTTPAKATSSFAYETDKVTESTSESNISIDTTYQGYYWTYGTGYTINESTGKFTLTGVSTCKYNDGTCHETLVGKYIVSTSASSNSSSSNTKKTTSNLSNIYKVTTAPASSTSSITMKAKKITPIPYSTEKVLSVTSDDYGTSYYYRGGVEDNYVTFADMCWRIVRINGDGTTKLILEDQDQPCSPSINGNWAIPTTTGGTTTTGNYGYTQYSSGGLTASDGTTTNTSTKYIMDYLHGTTNSAKSMATAFKNFQNTFTTEELAKLKSGDWCMADNGYSRSGSSGSYEYTLLNDAQMLDNKVAVTPFYYDSYTRLNSGSANGYQPTLKCTGTVMNDWDDTDKTAMYVGALTADEIVYAGGKVGANNYSYYLLNDYQRGKSLYFWSLSPFSFGSSGDFAFCVGNYGSLSSKYVNNVGSFRPSVSLASGAVITSGNGTLENPYIIG